MQVTAQSARFAINGRRLAGVTHLGATLKEGDGFDLAFDCEV